MNPITISLPLPPSANHRMGRGRNGKPFAKKETLEWRKEAGWMLHLARVPLFGQDVKVVVEAWISWPDNRKRDADNLWKEIQDLIQDAGIVKNDRQIIPRVMDWKVDRKALRNQRLKLRIGEGDIIPKTFMQGQAKGREPGKTYKGLKIKSEF